MSLSFGRLTEIEKAATEWSLKEYGANSSVEYARAFEMGAMWSDYHADGEVITMLQDKHDKLLKVIKVLEIPLVSHRRRCSVMDCDLCRAVNDLDLIMGKK